MVTTIFINLPVTDLPRSDAFYQAIGAIKNPQFSDATASCMIFSDAIQVMLMTHEKYGYFSSKQIADPKTTSLALMCLFVDSRQEVDAMMEKAKAVGAVLDPAPIDDYPFMYGRSFEDPDGHMWGVSWMDAEAAAKAMAASKNA